MMKLFPARLSSVSCVCERLEKPQESIRLLVSFINDGFLCPQPTKSINKRAAVNSAEEAQAKLMVTLWKGRRRALQKIKAFP